jgi:hypothetical protein
MHSGLLALSLARTSRRGPLLAGHLGLQPHR